MFYPKSLLAYKFYIYFYSTDLHSLNHNSQPFFSYQNTNMLKNAWIHVI